MRLIGQCQLSELPIGQDGKELISDWPIERMSFPLPIRMHGENANAQLWSGNAFYTLSIPYVCL